MEVMIFGAFKKTPVLGHHVSSDQRPSAHRDLYFGGPVGGNTFPFPIRSGRFPSYTVSRVAMMIPLFRSSPTICTFLSSFRSSLALSSKNVSASTDTFNFFLT